VAGWLHRPGAALLRRGIALVRQGPGNGLPRHDIALVRRGPVQDRPGAIKPRRSKAAVATGAPPPIGIASFATTSYIGSAFRQRHLREERLGIMAEKDRVVLAYSGGLDTSVCVKWLQVEKNLDVIAICGNVGQDEQDLKAIKDKAIAVGAIASDAVDLREEYADNYLTRALAANALYENEYPLLSALSRPLLAKKMVDVAHEYGAKYIAHGCTGKGNDQVRFENSIKALDPSITILAPVREWNLKSREDEMEYAQANGVPVGVTKASPYSIDDNLWGRAIECGVLEDLWNEPTPDVWQTTVDPEKAPDKPTYVEVEFEKGVPVALDGKKMSFLDIIIKLNEISGANGYGRLDMVENRVVGVKSRECYEVPAALSLIKAHKALETVTLDRETMHYKLNAEHKWAECVYYGQWYSPLKSALDAFMADTQKFVTGTIRLKYYKGSCTVVGRKSPYSLYDFGLATYGAEDTFDRTTAEGFIYINGLQNETWAKVQGPSAHNA
jgi:argininosuccinate synthase